MKRTESSRLSMSHDDLLVKQPIEKDDGKKPLTKIRIWHPYEPSAQITKHPINKMFESYNEFCRIVFNRQTYEENYKTILPRLLKLAKKLSLPLLKGQLNPNHLKNFDNRNILKENIVRQWCRTLQE